MECWCRDEEDEIENLFGLYEQINFFTFHDLHLTVRLLLSEENNKERIITYAITSAAEGPFEDEAVLWIYCGLAFFFLMKRPEMATTFIRRYLSL